MIDTTVETSLLGIELSDDQFQQVRDLAYKLAGINLSAGKEGLVKARLLKRMRALHIHSFDEYLDMVGESEHQDELWSMIDVLTTNKTSFFRESRHFDFVRDRIVPAARMSGQPLRIWCAGCSSGEEPYTLAIVIREAWPETTSEQVRILATDISMRMLDLARDGVYSQENLADLPTDLRQRHFAAVNCKGRICWQVKPETRRLVQFARLNLMDDWPMRGLFDAVFCRNVMIYFDKPTQQHLISRFGAVIRPGGHLFVGHSESLSTWSHEFRYVQPAVYSR